MKLNTLKTSVTFLLLICSSLASYGQLLDNSSFKIYRAFVLGSITEIRLNSDKTFDQYVTEFNCSLCDKDELIKTLTEKGEWTQKNDTIILNGNRKFHVQSESELINLDLSLFGNSSVIDTISNEKKEKIKEILLKTNPTVFRLVYDTYKNGVVKSITDKYRGRRNEYVIKFTENGEVISVDYFWDDKIRKRIKE